MTNIISFPTFNITLSIDPVAFSFCGISVRWYGLTMLLGIIAGLFCTTKEIKKLGLSVDEFFNLVLYAVPIAVVSSRIYYVAFSWWQYKSDIWSSFKIWHGGLAIYGGLIGAVLTTFVYCRVRQLSVAQIFDASSVGLLLGQSIGRWGNFFNAEAYGVHSDVPWRMDIISPWNNVLGVHPTFIYESLWNILGVMILFLYKSKIQKCNGELFLFYIVYYGLGRCFIERLRADSLMLGVYKVSQVLAAFSVIFGTMYMIYLRKKASERGRWIA